MGNHGRCISRGYTFRQSGCSAYLGRQTGGTGTGSRQLQGQKEREDTWAKVGSGGGDGEKGMAVRELEGRIAWELMERAWGQRGSVTHRSNSPMGKRRFGKKIMS